MIKLKEYFKLNGAIIINNPKNADYVILSTCAFKEEEENYSLSRLRNLKKYNGKLLVLGCLPDIAPTKFKEFAGTKNIAPRNLDQIDTFFSGNTIKYSDINDTNTIPKKIAVSSLSTALQKFRDDFDLSSAFRSRITRYLDKKIRLLLRLDAHNFYLSTGRGCLGNCAYCAIRRSIGTLISQPIDGIIKQFHCGLEKGFKDFIMLGDDVGAYGIDQNQKFPELMSRLINELREMTDKTPENKRLANIKLHIQEIHPHWLIKYTQEMLDLVKSKKIKSILCPIESGNDRILGLMNRRYNVDEIAAFFREARSIYPDIQLTTHIMVGFPTETEK
jgi:threonylcarbamoyladenosine tRNA methylthiotransferase CDKAL1